MLGDPKTLKPSAFTSGMTLATALAAPVEDGMMLPAGYLGFRGLGV